MPFLVPPSPVEVPSELREACTRFLTRHGPVVPAQLLAGIPADTVPGQYGEGGVVAVLETEIADLLGKPAALYLPSGIMAQQSVLRVHADRRQRRTVVYHPMCHLERHEGQARQRLHGLTGRPAGDADRLLSLDELTVIGEAPAALVIERPHAEIAALFDTVYVSFYKGLGALPGCCLAGPQDVIAEVREWRQRMGGTLFGLWPGAASALSSLRRRLPLMPQYLRHARAIAAALAAVPRVRVVPDPPQVSMMHLLLRTTPEAFVAAATRLAREQGIWTFPRAAATAAPDVVRLELAVGDATCELAPDQIAAIVAALTA
jgi:threonine aldolase